MTRWTTLGLLCVSLPASRIRGVHVYAKGTHTNIVLACVCRKVPSLEGWTKSLFQLPTTRWACACCLDLGSRNSYPIYIRTQQLCGCMAEPFVTTACKIHEAQSFVHMCIVYTKRTRSVTLFIYEIPCQNPGQSGCHVHETLHAVHPAVWVLVSNAFFASFVDPFFGCVQMYIPYTRAMPYTRSIRYLLPFYSSSVD